MKVRLLEVRLQTQCFLERDLRVGKLISLRQDGSKFIPQVGALRSEFYCTPHLRQRLISRPLTQNPRQHAVRLCVPWSSLQRRARLLLALCGFPLLRQHARAKSPLLRASCPCCRASRSADFAGVAAVCASEATFTASVATARKQTSLKGCRNTMNGRDVLSFPHYIERARAPRVL